MGVILVFVDRAKRSTDTVSKTGMIRNNKKVYLAIENVTSYRMFPG